MSTELLYRDDAYLKSAAARVLEVSERGIELDRTIFYPLGGGQPGDRGTLVRESGERIAIADTRKGESPGSVLHMPAPGSPRLEPGEPLTIELDWDRRYALMRLHTALELTWKRRPTQNREPARRPARAKTRHAPSGTGRRRVGARL